MKKITNLFKKYSLAIFLFFLFGTCYLGIAYLTWLPPFQNNGFVNITIHYDIQDDEWGVTYYSRFASKKSFWGSWKVPNEKTADSLAAELKAGRFPKK